MPELKQLRYGCAQICRFFAIGNVVAEKLKHKRKRLPHETAICDRPKVSGDVISGHSIDCVDCKIVLNVQDTLIKLFSKMKFTFVTADATTDNDDITNRNAAPVVSARKDGTFVAAKTITQ